MKNGLISSILFVAELCLISTIQAASQDCRLTNAGREYAGPVNVTRRGVPCQAWNSDTPHVTYFKDSKLYPEGSAAAAGNKCRNPDKSYNGGVWCYTTDPNKRWDLCDVPLCDFTSTVRPTIPQTVATSTKGSSIGPNICGSERGPRDCGDIKTNRSGIYRVYPGSKNYRFGIEVFCDFETSKDGWLVFQRRQDGSVKFERDWNEYEIGFGSLTGEFWLGNEKLSLLTTYRKYKLRVDLEDFTGRKRFAEYKTFSVKPGVDKYQLAVSGYSAGTAGDSLGPHNGFKFSTEDSDNDVWGGNCAHTYRGAWWYGACHTSNLNGLYLNGTHTSFADGIEWSAWRGYYYSFKRTEMKIAPVE